MENVLKNLSEKSILHRQQVMEIKAYIDKKYAASTSARRATIFANTVHQIVDESVHRFEEKHRLHIRSEVLKSAIAKDIFEISGYDVFEVCSTMEMDEEDDKDLFFSHLTDWVNENQDLEVSQEETRAMAQTVLDRAISSVVDILEESILVDQEIIEINNRSTDRSPPGRKGPEELEGPEFIENLPNILDDHITDGRFMDVEGEIKELTAEDIEKALKEEIPDSDNYGFDDSIILEKDPMLDPNDPGNLAGKVTNKVSSETEEVDRRSLPVEDRYSALSQGTHPAYVSRKRDEATGSETGNEVDSSGQHDDDLSQESMDRSLGTQSGEAAENQINPTEGTESKASSMDDEVFDSMDGFFGDEEAQEMVEPDPDDNVNWEEITMKPKKRQVTRLGGYELNPPQVVIENNDDKMPNNIRLLLIIPIVLILVMVIIVLIIAAIQISQRAAITEADFDRTSIETQIVNMEDFVYEETPEHSPKLAIKNSSTIEKLSTTGQERRSDQGAHLHEDLQYREISNERLIRYLEDKSSSLAEEHYVSTLIDVAWNYNVNPLLLVAITGQEQGFVPRDNDYADEIVNNPFNVYNSWKDYNTDFENACKIAAGTVVELSKGRPEEEDPIQWINRRYAEDENWHLGVTYFLKELTALMNKD